MKKMIYGLTMAAVVLLAGACEKENPSPVAAAESSLKPKPQGESSEKSTITITQLTQSYSCGAAICNQIEVMPNPPKYNLINVQTSHSGGGTIKYVLYEMQPWAGTPFEVGAKLAEFNCSLSSTNYASGLLNNGAKVMVWVMHTTDSAPLSVITNANVFSNPNPGSAYAFVTLGNYKGTPGCGDSDN